MTCRNTGRPGIQDPHTFAYTCTAPDCPETTFCGEEEGLYNDTCMTRDSGHFVPNLGWVHDIGGEG